MKSNISVVITDLDNTLYDWVEMWYHAFSAMLNKLVDLSGIDQGTLESEIRRVFQKYGTSKYAFVIEELPSLTALHPGGNLVEIYQPAIQAYIDARKKALDLYPTVRDTLLHLRQKGCLIVVFTESMAFYTERRIQQLGLEELVDFLYSPEDHPLPSGVTREQIRTEPPESYVLKHVKHRFTPEGERKPNPGILREIVREIGARDEQTIYVGDGLMKDVLNANSDLTRGLTSSI